MRRNAELEVLKARYAETGNIFWKRRIEDLEALVAKAERDVLSVPPLPDTPTKHPRYVVIGTNTREVYWFARSLTEARQKMNWIWNNWRHDLRPREFLTIRETKRHYKVGEVYP